MAEGRTTFRNRRYSITAYMSQHDGIRFAKDNDMRRISKVGDWKGSGWIVQIQSSSADLGRA